MSTFEFRSLRLSVLVFAAVFSLQALGRPSNDNSTQQCLNYFENSYFISKSQVESRFLPADWPAFSAVAAPKEFSMNERLEVEGIFPELAAMHPILSRAVEFFRDQVHLRVLRTTFGAHEILRPNPRWIRDPFVVGSHYAYEDVILLTDLFFQDSDNWWFNGARSGTRAYRRSVMLHEFGHSMETLLTKEQWEEFLELADWRYVDRSFLPDKVNDPFVSLRFTTQEVLVTSERQHLQRRYNRNREAEELGAAFARSRGFPSLRAMENPGEHFAELWRSYFEDSKFRTYTKVELARWLEGVLQIFAASPAHP